MRLIFCILFSLRCFADVPTLRFEVVARYAHLNTPFTQGFEIDGDTVFESSGLYNRSFIATWHLNESHPIAKQTLPNAVFGEGLTLWGDRIYTVTWREQRGFIFDKNTLQKIGEFSYAGEGWGLTHNERMLILSDGTNTLRFIDPRTLNVKEILGVFDNGTAIDNLNELEWIPAYNGEPARLLANIWQSDEIVVIDAENGQIKGRLDLSKLYPKSTRSAKADVLNGIAFDARDHTLLITGKFWPYVYRIRVLDALP